MSTNPFALGRRWLSRSTGKYGCRIVFVIVGAGSDALRSPSTAKSYKRCRLECIAHQPGSRHIGCGHGIEQDYSHKHLKKYAEPMP